MTIRISMLVVGMAAFSALACGGSSKSDAGDRDSGAGDQDSSPTVVSSGLPDATALGDLSDAQLQELCSELSDTAKATFEGDAVRSATCDYSAFVASSLGAEQSLTCEDIRAECLQQPMEPTETGSCTPPSPDCRATVGEYERCVTDIFAGFAQTIEALPGCADVGTDVETSIPAATELPASCMSLQQKCPEAFADVPLDDSAGDAD